jgi:hypothetical protein
MGNPNRTRSMSECILARRQNNFLRRRQRFEFPHSLDPERTWWRLAKISFLGPLSKLPMTRSANEPPLEIKRPLLT